MFCDCKDIIVLMEGDGEFIAREIFCKKHGYQNNCYRCHPETFNTELCLICKWKPVGTLYDPLDSIDLRTKGSLEKDFMVKPGGK